eukprot:SAG11_NODE_27245_length_335_cov_0.610169_2_plen_40_part_01
MHYRQPLGAYNDDVWVVGLPTKNSETGGDGHVASFSSLGQ